MALGRHFHGPAVVFHSMVDSRQGGRLFVFNPLSRAEYRLSGVHLLDITIRHP